MAESARKKQPAASLLTDDVVVEILSRVPYRSLCRFKCVSRSWLVLCSDPDLRKKSPQTLSGFFYRSCSVRYVNHFTNMSGRGRPMVNPSLSFLLNPPSYTETEFVNCCNGLLLCRCWRMSPRRYEYVVCNPATEKWTVSPNTEAMQTSLTVRLGFDPAMSSHFSVFLLGHGQDVSRLVTGVEIYSSETRRWTYRQSEWGDDAGVDDATTSVFFNGIMHFTTNGSAVVTVDTEGKTWRKIPTRHRTDFSFIGLSQGRLYSAHIDYGGDPHLSIWVLEDYGSEQWILKHTVSTLGLFEKHPRLRGLLASVIAIHPERNLVFLNLGMQRDLMSYDMDNRKVHAICTLGDECVHPYLPYIPCFSEWLSDGH